MHVTKNEIGARGMTNGKRETGNEERETGDGKTINGNKTECVMKLLI